MTPVGRALSRWANTRARREQREPRADVKLPSRPVSFADVLIDKAITTRDDKSSSTSGRIQQGQQGDTKLEEAAQPVRLRREQLFARKKHKCLERKRSEDREREGGGPSRNTSRNKQETYGSRHSTAPPGAQNALCGFVFRKVRRILLRLRQKKSTQSKRRNESYGRLKKGSRFLHWGQGKHGPDQSHKSLDFAVGL